MSAQPAADSHKALLAEYRKLIAERPNIVHQRDEAQALVDGLDARLAEVEASILGAMKTTGTPANMDGSPKRRPGRPPTSGGLTRWQVILQIIGRNGGAATNQQLYAGAPQAGAQDGPKHENAIRSLLSTSMKKRGFVTSNGAGLWSLTDKGRQEFERIKD